MAKRNSISSGEHINTKPIWIFSLIIFVVLTAGLVLTYVLVFQPKAAKEIRFVEQSITITKGQRINPSVLVLPERAANKDYKLSSANLNVVTVDENGFKEIYGFGIGTTTLTATSVYDTALTHSVEVTVVPAVNIIGLEDIKSEIKVGDIIDVSGVAIMEGTMTLQLEIDSPGSTSDEARKFYYKQGGTYEITFRARQSDGRTFKSTISIKVYGAISFTARNPEVSAVALSALGLSDPLTTNAKIASAMHIVAHDSFGITLESTPYVLKTENEQTTRLSIADANIEAGKTYTFEFEVKDKIGQVATATVKDVNVYGTPTITYDSTKTYQFLKDVDFATAHSFSSIQDITLSYFAAAATDSFNQAIAVTEMSLSYDTTLVGVVPATITARDIVGNVATQNINITVFGTPEFQLYAEEMALKLSSIHFETQGLTDPAEKIEKQNLNLFGLVSEISRDSLNRPLDLTVTASALGGGAYPLDFLFAGGEEFRLTIEARDAFGQLAGTTHEVRVKVYSHEFGVSYNPMYQPNVTPPQDPDGDDIITPSYIKLEKFADTVTLDELLAEIGIEMRDSFGQELDVTLTIEQNGESFAFGEVPVIAGVDVVLVFTATDDAANTSSFSLLLRVYDNEFYLSYNSIYAPTIVVDPDDGSETIIPASIKQSDLTALADYDDLLELLGFRGYDCYGEDLVVTQVEVKQNGNVLNTLSPVFASIVAGQNITITIHVIHPTGNSDQLDIELKVYDAPVITNGITGIFVDSTADDLIALVTAQDSYSDDISAASIFVEFFIDNAGSEEPVDFANLAGGEQIIVRITAYDQLGNRATHEDTIAVQAAPAPAP